MPELVRASLRQELLAVNDEAFLWPRTQRWASTNVRESIDEDDKGSVARMVGGMQMKGWHFVELGRSAPTVLMMHHLRSLSFS